jgi:phosphopantetheine adenylyltransferase
MLRSEKENFRLFFAISNEKTGITPVQNRNAAMKNGKVSIDNGKVEVGDGNVAETEAKFSASLIKRGKKNTEFETLEQIASLLNVQINQHVVTMKTCRGRGWEKEKGY